MVEIKQADFAGPWGIIKEMVEKMKGKMDVYAEGVEGSFTFKVNYKYYIGLAKIPSWESKFVMTFEWNGPDQWKMRGNASPEEIIVARVSLIKLVLPAQNANFFIFLKVPCFYSR